MITCYLKGGCGNQLFQIFTTISYALDYEEEFWFFDKIYFNTNPQRYTYWDDFLSNLMPFVYKTIPNKIKNKPIFEVKEKNFSYNKIQIINNENNFIFKGYFQSYKYFNINYNKICGIINLNSKKEQTLQKFITNNNFNNFSECINISIHFRLGDYKKVKNIHPIISYSYYKNSVTHILSYIENKTQAENKKINILYFHENNDINDIKIVNIVIKELNKDFPNLFFFEVINLLDWEQLLLMSCCNHNIIPNSTFSWWGAYFNSNENKIVTYPSKWFGEDCNNNTNDLFPSNWTCINV